MHATACTGLHACIYFPLQTTRTHEQKQHLFSSDSCIPCSAAAQYSQHHAASAVWEYLWRLDLHDDSEACCTTSAANLALAAPCLLGSEPVLLDRGDVFQPAHQLLVCSRHNWFKVRPCAIAAQCAHRSRVRTYQPGKASWFLKTA